MGVTAPIAEFLVEARLTGGPLGRTLTLGHQALFVSPRRLRRLLADNGLWPSGASPDDFLASFTGATAYVDPFLRALGATEVDVLDASPYEGARVLHDLNEPIPDALKGTYDTVFDGGTLEHVFHLPTALRSCMELLRPGGRLVTNAVANQLLGHGFYQFSPELFFRALSPDNGFEVVRMHGYEGILTDSTALGFPYEFQRFAPRFVLRDPREHGGRHELLSGWPFGLLVEARKTADVPVFATAPQQSDYAATWEAHTAAGDGAEAPLPARPSVVETVKARVRDRLTPELRTLVWWEVVPRLLLPLDPLRTLRFRRRASLRNRRMFEPAPRLLRRPLTRA
jgi:SAM-dependent methyltransferase